MNTTDWGYILGYFSTGLAAGIAVAFLREIFFWVGSRRTSRAFRRSPASKVTPWRPHHLRGAAPTSDGNRGALLSATLGTFVLGGLVGFLVAINLPFPTGAKADPQLAALLISRLPSDATLERRHRELVSALAADSHAVRDAHNPVAAVLAERLPPPADVAARHREILDALNALATPRITVVQRQDALHLSPATMAFGVIAIFGFVLIFALPRFTAWRAARRSAR